MVGKGCEWQSLRQERCEGDEAKDLTPRAGSEEAADRAGESPDSLYWPTERLVSFSKLSSSNELVDWSEG
jgi:hypothetical protein